MTSKRHLSIGTRNASFVFLHCPCEAQSAQISVQVLLGVFSFARKTSIPPWQRQFMIKYNLKVGPPIGE